ncbi:hypothetical protein AB9K26_06010 [Psychroserpens sp. XS_ASV72]|uniref:hypothetical protein n=1 Tax=Psychroserpens sp. XS_ASV72 TaxID=3241293 RepID=UPI003517EA07
MFKKRDIDALNLSSVLNEAVEELEKSLKKYAKGYDVLILSHEYFFQCPMAIANLSRICSKLFQQTMVIGYSRKQSGFLESSYSQWFFRSKQYINDAKATLEKNSFDPVVFDGLERYLIAAIHDDFNIVKSLFKFEVFNWFKSYQHVKELTSDANVEIKCGTLPTQNSTLNLIEDFCLKAGVTIKDNHLDKTALRLNTKFNPHLVEAISIAVDNELETIGMHDENDVLVELSEIMKAFEWDQKNAFLNHLKNYIDSLYQEANSNLCEMFGLDASYFKTKESFSKQEMMSLIKKEEALRKSDIASLVESKGKLAAIMAKTALRTLKNKN